MDDCGDLSLDCLSEVIEIQDLSDTVESDVLSKVS